MRIKKLEIHGFKSFCDRSVLTFDDPITGVVGPNGCGKSNIVDAIRWCMGEQSAKHLRGKAMDDVIFAGSDSRKASTLAEVSLTFENDGRVPADFLSYAEITVTRRLHRDGTSEYLINKIPCRLRDVTDFFLGTGVGVRAYSIIEQGRVGMIVSSKPEDRRLLIEEAAGITKYKLKKKAAEKRMEWTRQNLLRVSDVIAEVEKQLASLRRQAQKAERYKQYRAEMRDIELWSAAQRWLGFHAEERVAGWQLAEVQAEREGQQGAFAAREAELETARLQAAEQGERIDELQERLYETDNKLRLGEAEAEHQQKEAAGLEERATHAETEIELLLGQIAASEQELARIRAAAEEVDQGTSGQAEELVRVEEHARMIKARLAEVQAALEGAKSEIGRAQAEIARGESGERSVARRIDDLDLRIARVAEEAGRLDGRGAELGGHIDEHEGALAGLRQTRLDLSSQTARMEERLVTVKDEVAREEADLEVLTGELHRKRSRHASLAEIAAKYEGFERGTRAIMKQRDERWGIHGLVADVIQAPPEFEVAVEAALGERLGSVVVESHEVGVDGIEHLKQTREGRSSFVPVRARPGALAGEATEALLPPADEGEERPAGVRGRMLDLVRCDEEFRGIAEALLGDVVIVDDLITAVDLWRAGARGTLVTVEGEVVDGRGIVVGGSRDAQGVEAAGVLAQKRELRELEEVVARLTERHDGATERLAELRAERQRIQVTLEQLRKDGHQGEMAILTHEKDLARYREELARLGQRRQVLAGEEEELRRQRDEAAREGEEARMALRRARELLVGAEDARDGRGREVVAQMDQLEEANALVTELKIRTAQVEEKRRALRQALERAAAQRREQDDRQERLARTVEDSRRRAGELRALAEEERGVIAALLEESKRLGDALATARSGYEERRAALLGMEAAMKTARASLEEAAARAGQLELRVREAQMNRSHLEAHVEDRYRLNITEHLADHHLRPPVGEAEEARLRELRDLIDRMGEINLTAIEEYKALEERYNFLVAQRGDLETALAQLEDAIDRINKTSRKRFREVFDLINEKFQELFPRLFRGGRAYLRLTNEEDVLESGIEILAQPPGKKNATVELLSGGEKALTAISLVFAIFLIKPSPFCILDEVDAPLDEANVGRYNDLLRAITDRTQFIVITHNKRTMEVTDTLYGVTMEEPGISKLVSVNLSGGRAKAA